MALPHEAMTRWLDRPSRQAMGNPFWHALRGTLAPLALGDEHAVRFHPEVNVFAALPDEPSEQSWQALAELLGPDGLAVLAGEGLSVPSRWRLDQTVPGVQLVAPPGMGRSWADVEDLTELDADDMLALAQASPPGPYLRRTVEQGGFVGLHQDGRLVAMAGERSRVPGATEISSVCTSPAYRGLGLAGRLVQHLVDRVERRGEVAFLHTAADNAPALALYEKLGFVVLSRPVFVSVRPPLEVAA